MWQIPRSSDGVTGLSGKPWLARFRACYFLWTRETSMVLSISMNKVTSCFLSDIFYFQLVLIHAEGHHVLPNLKIVDFLSTVAFFALKHQELLNVFVIRLVKCLDCRMFCVKNSRNP